MIGQFYAPDIMQDWFLKDGLPKAKQMLAHFKTLDALFSSFKDYEKKTYKQINNFVLRLCLPELKGGSRYRSIKTLQEFEEALLLFGISSWRKDRINHFRSRLCSDDYCTSLSPYTEVVVAKRLAEKFGRDKVDLYPPLSIGGFSDVILNLSDKEVYIEVGNLGQSCPESKIQKIIDVAASHLGNKLKNSCYMKVEIDSAELALDKDGHIDVGASTDKITLEMDRLCLDKLASFKGSFMLDCLADVIRNKTTYEDLLNKGFSIPDVMCELQLSGTSPVKEWIDSCKNQIIKGSGIIKSITGSPARFLLVEIHTEMFYPSKAALAERDSFVNHVIRHIEAQLEEKQLEPDHPNIIIVQGYNWVAFGLDYDFQEIRLLYEKVKEFLNEKDEKHLSGIALLSGDFKSTIFISNEKAGIASKLNKDEIENLGMIFVG